MTLRTLQLNPQKAVGHRHGRVLWFFEALAGPEIRHAFPHTTRDIGEHDPLDQVDVGFIVGNPFIDPVVPSRCLDVAILSGHFQKAADGSRVAAGKVAQFVGPPGSVGWTLQQFIDLKVSFIGGVISNE